MARPTGGAPPLGHNNLWAIWPGLFAVSMGLMALLPTLPLYIEERFGIEDPAELQWWSAVIFGVSPLSAALLGPIWGGLGDRVGRKPMVLRAMLAVAIVTAWMPLADTPLQLTLLRILMGAFAGYVAPAMALVSASVSEARQGRTIAQMQLALAMGTVSGPLLGAELASIAGRESVFWLSSGLAFVAAGLAWWFAQEDRSGLVRRAAGTSWVRDLAGQTVSMFRNRVFVALLGLVFLMRFGQNMVEPFVALFVRAIGPLDWLRSYDVTFAVDRTTAIAFGVLAVVQLIVTPIWGRLADRIGPLACLSAAALALSGVLFTIAAAETSETFLAWRAVAAVFMAGTMTLAYAAATKRVAPARRGIAFSMVQSFTQLGLALGPICGAWVVGSSVPEDPAAHDGGESLRTLFRLAAGATLLAGIGMLVLRTSRPAKFETLPADSVSTDGQ